MKKDFNYGLLRHNTFGMNVNARYFFEYDSVEGLEDISFELNKVAYSGKPVLHIGEGSNLLFTKDFDGIVIHSAIQNIQKISERKNVIVLRVGGGMKWDDFVAYCVLNGYCGIENLSGVPGEVGAAAVQNIGAYGCQVSDSILRIETLDLETGKPRLFKPKECQYGYRSSIFKKELKGKYVITYVYFKLAKYFTPNLSYKALRNVVESKYDVRHMKLSDMREEVIALRNSKLPDPQVLGNAGSFFMNPVITLEHYQKLTGSFGEIPSYPVDEEHVKVPAAWLIEQCGWKGKSLGNAGVYSKQPLVLVNNGNATGEEVVALAEAIQKDVYEKFQIELKPEVNII